MKVIQQKFNKDIANEWNNIALLRQKQIESKMDTSFHQILLPNISKQMDLIENLPQKKLIDLGCGSGYLTNYLSLSVKKTIGIDLSSKNIELAQKKYTKENLHFYKSSIEEFNKDTYDIAVANMVLMDVVNLDKCIKSISNLIVENGNFIFSITHPYFWPKYWKYEDEVWYNYSREIIIETEFKIANEITPYETTHIHRPLGSYIKLLKQYSFEIDSILELPNDEKSKYPRFLIINCKKIKNKS
ncbi:class I SAM-dependent methyltransferase [Streptococcus parasanguinis]|jgi:2-polyprenyl-3-methyl-5-hydroxy-6-metoxy-1,4-benzoquinol methylase|uniref:class I SAM-dependent methyltransferase n=1 Tax=Streptococcus parasanguinis TaxID=1318 RepID=UPI0020C86BAA|nr:class I SAM-dependent methyltransferase [Streptococcus parasanguinis]MCP9067244.1 class I SAM-dependent methyltransferase [Streptococcus parasanguinis]